LPRHRDHNDVVGNLPEGATLFGPEPIDTFPMNPWSADELIAIHRTRNSFRDAAPAAFRSAPFRTRSLRRS
jgi:hypothetical protein